MEYTKQIAVFSCWLGTVMIVDDHTCCNIQLIWLINSIMCVILM